MKNLRVCTNYARERWEYQETKQDERWKKIEQQKDWPTKKHKQATGDQGLHAKP